ncbi:M20 family metallopeptidase [Amycolatopsis sp. K13G38]|uniref:M20 family metallopeptidase n=1 Tax=Amycolatopsis acididurans TaxID=2724524 RepID=A0ABX1J2P3_9PSEU|nr:M20 family metallopeptidase [Amycolatopsis acididurans]NKQ53651.1 M20 family metallopeptidase [Amycolatopsis acididurans]
MTEDLRALVGLETPSHDKALLDAGLTAIHRWLADRLGTPGELHRHDGGGHGDVLEVTYPGTTGEVVLLLCHYDTVWPEGTLAQWPFEVSGTRASGPGAFDMKLGLVQAVWGLRCVRKLGLPAPTVKLLLTGDEEIGSPAGRPHIERVSEGARATLVFEASLGGALKTGRKGVGLFDVTVRGIEAHAGLEPDAGVSAIHQLAGLVPRIAGLADPAAGTTVNVGLIAGGTGRNVVAGEATCGIDVRVGLTDEVARLDAAFAALAPSDPRARVSVRGEWNRPPMVPNPASERLFKIAHGVAADLGLTLGEVSVGGASDANFVSALGRPVLDGLGAVGAGAHARHEHVLLDHVPVRTALLAGLLTALA